MVTKDKPLVRAFGARLKKEMIAQGYNAPWSKLGADANALRKAAGVSSLDIARRYLAGENMPRPDTMKKIADWLGVRIGWLRDGELPKTDKEHTAANTVDPALLQKAIGVVVQVNNDRGLGASSDTIARAAALLYTDIQAGRETPEDRIIDTLRVFTT